MLQVLIDAAADIDRDRHLRETIGQRGLLVADWLGPETDDFATTGDALVTIEGRLELVHDAYHRDRRVPNLAVIAKSPTAPTVRHLLHSGVATVIDASDPVAAQATAAAACAMGMSCMPSTVASDLATRLDEPPRALTLSEQELLATVASSTIERAAEQLGYSRRQMQRRFRALADDLKLGDHLDVAVAAGRWGLATRS